jgi:hypothetical protein
MSQTEDAPQLRVTVASVHVGWGFIFGWARDKWPAALVSQTEGVFWLRVAVTGTTDCLQVASARVINVGFIGELLAL